MKIELTLEDLDIEVDIILTPDGIAKIRKDDTNMPAGKWAKEDNTLSVDIPGLDLADASDQHLCFEITTDNKT